MPELSEERKRKLAEVAGLKKYQGKIPYAYVKAGALTENKAAYSKNGEFVCWVQYWNPLLPAHGDLVLRALVFEDCIAAGELLEEIGLQIVEADGKETLAQIVNNFWPAVCAAALEVMEAK